LDIYTDPVAFEGHNMRVVLQCRQSPTSISTCGETIGWTAKFGTVPISPHVDNKDIECFTSSRRCGDPLSSAHQIKLGHAHVSTMACQDL
jgi:hypothetical protein